MIASDCCFIKIGTVTGIGAASGIDGFDAFVALNGITEIVGVVDRCL